MRHNQLGYYSLKDLPQRQSIAGSAYGTQWPELDEILKFYLGQFVVVTGTAGSGKSTFLMNVLCNMAREDGIRAFMYTPENEMHVREKLRKIWCQGGKRSEASFAYYAENQCFIQSSVPSDYDNEAKTLPWVLDKAVVAVERDQCSIVLLDPWNEIERAKPRDMLLTDYIGECIMLMKQFCRCYSVILIIVAHPTKAVNENGGRLPRLCDIEGSMAWWNKCDNGLIVARDKDRNRARVVSEKVREIGAGKLGECYFQVDPETGIFTPDYGGVIVRQ